ncbi:MAG TPA: YihY/virulence factor BrkB family protein [Stellaceae bacterium]|jgi:membrane protein|nr:YihY/virulence factor BrkB family protein [Stellaceae bacterium]
MSAGIPDTKILRDAKRALALRIIPQARHWREIVRREWWAILLATGARISRDNVSILAAGVAFYIFVAIPSSLTAIVSVYGLMFNPLEVENQVSSMIGVLPADVIEIVTNFLKLLAAKPQSTLGLRLILGLIVAIWSAQSAASAMISALDAAYEQKETRGYLRFQLAALVLSLCSIVFALLSLILFAVLPVAIDFLMPFAHRTRLLVEILRWPALTALVAFAIAGVYRFGPMREASARPWGAWGVVLTTIVWIGSSALFALYVSKVASYDVSYGPLGAVVVLLLWLYIAAFVVLLGAELNAELESRMAAERARFRPANETKPTGAKPHRHHAHHG